MFEKITAFFMSIIAFFLGLFGISYNGNPVTPAGENYTQYINLSYGSGERQKLDLCIPNDASGDLGLVLFIHGGAWIAGDKGSYKNGVKSASETYGFAGASINYRYISDEIDFNDILDDIDAALACIKAKGAELGVNINKVLLTGDSAGGHLSLLYAYSRAGTAPIAPNALFM